MPIMDIFTSNAGKFSGNFIAVYETIKERYAEFRVSTHQLCYKALNDIGIGKRVFLLGQNSPFYIKWFFALSATNNVSIHIPPTVKEEQLEYYVLKYKPNAIVTEEPFKKMLGRIIQSNDLAITLIDITQNYLTIYNEEFNPPPNLAVKDSDIATAFFTQGAEDRAPKLVAFSHETIKYITKMNRTCFKISGADRIYSTFSYSGFFGLITMAMSAIQSGSSLLYPPVNVEEKLLFKFFNDIVMTCIFTTPLELTHYIKNIKENELLKIRKAHVTGARVGEYVTEYYCSTRDMSLVEIYGNVEAGWTISINREGDEYKFGTQGKVFPGLSYKVMTDGSDDELKVGIGRLAIRGSAIMSGYFDEIFEVLPPPDKKKPVKAEEKKEPTPPKKTFLPGSWFVTDDFVEVDSDGYFHYIGRITDKDRIADYMKERAKRGADKKRRTVGKEFIDAMVEEATVIDEQSMKDIISKIKAENNMHIVEPQFYDVETIRKSQGLCYVANVKDETIGFIRAFPFWPGNPFLIHICTIDCYVLEKFRTKSIGTQLIKKLLLELSKMGYKQVINIIPTGNVVGLAYARRFGYREAGRLTNFLKLQDGFTTACLFEKILDRGHSE